MAQNQSDKSKKSSSKSSSKKKTASRLSGGWKFFVGLVVALAILCILVLGYELINRLWPELLIREETVAMSVQAFCGRYI